jgi:membrane protein implicated in regulation of membrane protease activity
MLQRALATSALVGGVLFAVNSGGALLQQGFTASLFLKLTVTLVIPFAVSLTSAALTRRELEADTTQSNGGTP